MLKRLDHLSFRARSIAMRICVGALLSMAPPSLHAQEADRVSLWLTLFERPAGNLPTTLQLRSPSPFHTAESALLLSTASFSKRGMAKCFFAATRPLGSTASPQEQTEKARFSTTTLYGPARQEVVNNQTDWVYPLYRVMREGDVIYVEKAYFEERRANPPTESKKEERP